MVLFSFVLAVALAALHLLVERMPFLRAIPRSRWLSASSGSSVAYVFVHIFPELGAYQAVFAENDTADWLEHHVYVVALLGFCVYYGLERAAQLFAGRPSAEQVTELQWRAHRLFWVHIGAFALYYALIGYLLLHRGVPGPWGLFTYALAMGLHFVVIDVSLSSHHSHAYHRYGRWLLSVAVLVGWGIGWLGPLDDMLVGALFAFLAGGIILNAIKEELPADRQSRFWAFVSGALLFGLLLLATDQA